MRSACQVAPASATPQPAVPYAVPCEDVVVGTGATLTCAASLVSISTTAEGAVARVCTSAIDATASTSALIPAIRCRHPGVGARVHAFTFGWASNFSVSSWPMPAVESGSPVPLTRAVLQAIVKYVFASRSDLLVLFGCSAC